MKPGSNAEQKHSVLLTKDENEQVISLLGPKCYTKATTVVQLFCTDGPDGIYWIKKDVGVLCFVRDVNRRSYFLRLFNIAIKRMVWEHELYNNMEYLAPKSFLHTFEAEDRMVAFNFANEDEAAHMRQVLIEILRNKERKQLERQNRNNAAHGRNSLSQAPSRPAPPPFASNGYLYPKSLPMKPATGFATKTEKKKSKKKSITKADIGIPQDFRHVSHVGWDPTSGFDLENVEASMKQFFDKVGISENDLKDKETREFIYDFIEKHGGLDAVKMDIHHQSVPPPPSPPPPPPVPVRNPLPPTTQPLRLAPPPPPSRNAGSMHPAPPPPPSAPPPVNVLVQRNHEAQTKKPAPTVAMANHTPPPPPPPPLPPPNLLTEETRAVNNSSGTISLNSGPDPRAALMEAIRSGTILKHVETESRKTDDSRGELLNQIRQGVELKSVQPVEKPQMLPMDGLSGALARALAARSKMIHSDSSASSESEDTDSDEWG